MKCNYITITPMVRRIKIKWYKRLIYRIKTGKKSDKYEYRDINGNRVYYRVNLKGGKWLDER